MINYYKIKSQLLKLGILNNYHIDFANDYIELIWVCFAASFVVQPPTSTLFSRLSHHKHNQITTSSMTKSFGAIVCFIYFYLLYLRHYPDHIEVRCATLLY